MSASNEWTEWHLTPRGWERGDWKVDGGSGSSRRGLVPEDRVLTFAYREFMSSVYSPMDKGAEFIWQSDDKEKIKELRAKYGEPPEHL